MSNEIILTKQPAESSFDQSKSIASGTRVSNYIEDLEYSRRCKSFCCSQTLAERLNFAGFNKCWCCFDFCFSLVDTYLVSKKKKHHERIEETEEWMKGFSCWPLPILTITVCTIQLYFFVSFSLSPNHYRDELMNSAMIWHSSHRDEIHRWFTYSFLNADDRSQFFVMIYMQIALGLFIEFEHKWVRTTIIYVVGVISASLFHSVAYPCYQLVGSSVGIYALFGAGLIKLKRHKKYVGPLRRKFNLSLFISILLLLSVDLGSKIYSWVTCDITAKQDIIAIPGNVGGLIGGLVTGFIVLNKFQESVGQQRMREANEYQETTDHDVRYATCCNFANDAYLCNPDLIKLLKQPLTYILLVILIGSWSYCIVMNQRFPNYETLRYCQLHHCTQHLCQINKCENH